MKKLGLLIAPVLFALGCGGLDDVLGPADGGVCGGKDPFRLPTAAYKLTSVSLPVSDCDKTWFDPAAAQTALNQSSKDFSNVNGQTCFKNAGTTTDWACFQGNCNKITPVAPKTDQFINDGKCNCRQVVSITGDVTGIGQMSISVRADRDQCTSVTAGSCPQTKACSITYTTNLVGPAA